MKRVIAVLLMSVLATSVLGVDSTSLSQQDSRDGGRQRERDQVARTLGGMRRGATVEIVRTDGTKISAVIQDVGIDSVTVLTDERGQVETQTIAVSDIRSIKLANPRKMSHGHKVLLVTAVTLGVIVGVCAAIILNIDA
jgi:hypothetical protein